MTPAEICIPALAVGVPALVYLVYRMLDDLEKSYRLPEREAALVARRRDRSMSPTEMYLAGGGDMSNPRVASLLAEAERGWNRHQRPDEEGQA